MKKIKIDNMQRAEILVQALPYIQKYAGKVIVVKYGGNAMINPELKQAVMGDIVLLQLIGVKVVLVHGGGPDISEVLEKFGKKNEFIDGLRVTDAETAQIAQMVLAGKVGKSLVSCIESIGGNAIGLSGADGRLIEAKKKDDRLGFVGDITAINTKPILDLLANNYIPVISTTACDQDGNIYNINADTAAAAIAGALKAESMLSMTDITGVMRDPKDPNTLIPSIHVSDMEQLLAEGIISGGMIPKTQCCADAIRMGVRRVFIIDGRIPHAVLIELLTDEGIGTMFTA